MSFDSPTPISLPSAKFRRFEDVFHWFFPFYKLKVRRISASVLFYLLRQVWSRYGHPLPSYCIFAADTLRDLVTLTFDLMTLTSSHRLSYMAGHVVNTATKLEVPMPIHSWVMSYNVFHWLLLKMRFRLLRMHRITWPVRWGVDFANIFGITNTDLSIHYETSVALRWR